ncbi:MAG: hypothetical protein EXS67_05170 [Candidatus Margulisbacteria bacterium]|nr:hypothetical protein [Candidatus Margulisiibacteriota bacterium]
MVIIFDMVSTYIFEDDRFSSLFPLTFMRPAFDLLLGMERLIDKMVRYFPSDEVCLHVRPVLRPLLAERHPEFQSNELCLDGSCWLLNGRVVFTKALSEFIRGQALSPNVFFTYQGQVVAAYLAGDVLALVAPQFFDVPSSEALAATLESVCSGIVLDDVVMVQDVWDLVSLNPQILTEDLQVLRRHGVLGDVAPSVVLQNEEDIFIGQDVVIEDFVVINAKKGPVHLASGVFVESGSRLEGPLFVGQNSQVLGAKIRSCSIGPNCKVSGEISLSVFYGQSNKAHDGFMGHSYVGEWVNLGAGTTTSNLKNTYGPIRVQTSEGVLDTGLQFLGAMIGDYVKCGIGTLLNTGSVLGFGSTVWGGSFQDKYIAPFSWGGSAVYSRVELDRWLPFVSRVMQRRLQPFTASAQAVIRQIYRDEAQ